MKVKVILLIAWMMIVPLCGRAQVRGNGGEVESKYLAGSVPLVDGQVRFTDTVRVEGLAPDALYATLKECIGKKWVEGPDHLEKSRITEADSEAGLIVASIEEYLYFKRKAWTMDRVRFSYQVICRVVKGGYTLEMRRMQYQYDDIPNPEVLYAEDWITDAEALTDCGRKLLKKPGKFRRFTIDRKDEMFAMVRSAVDSAARQK